MEIGFFWRAVYSTKTLQYKNCCNRKSSMFPIFKPRREDLKFEDEAGNTHFNQDMPQNEHAILVFIITVTNNLSK